MRLRLTIPLGDQETATSFTSRLAAANGITAAEFCSDWGLTFKKIVDGEGDAIARIAELGGADAGMLLDGAFVRDDRRIRRGNEVLSRQSMRNGRFAVCPACLRGDIRGNKDPDLEPELLPYGRAAWRIDAIRTCAVHDIALFEIADHARGYGEHDFATRMVQMVPKLGVLIAAAAKRRPNGLEAYVVGRLNRRAQSEFLDGLDLFAAIRVCEVFGAVALFGLWVNVRDLSGDKLMAAGGRGFEIAAGGPTSIREFLDQLMQTSGDRDRKDGPRVVFGRIHEWLLSHAGDAAYDPVRTLVGQHVLDSFPLGVNARLFGRTVGRQVRHSIRTLSLETGRHPKRLRRLLRIAGVIGDDQMALSDHNVRFDAELGAAAVAKEAEDSLSLAAAQQYLNTPRTQAGVLVGAGIIKPCVSAGAFGGYDRYATADLDAFLGRLTLGAKPVVRPKSLEANIPDAAKQACCSAADIVRLILEKNLPWVGRLRGERGYLSVLVNVEHVRTAVRGPDHGGVPLRELTTLLQTSSLVVTRLIANEILPTFTARNPVNRCMQRLVLREELERFQRTYVSLHVLGKERGRHAMAVASELDSAGIKPAFGDVKLGARFYLRARVSKI